MQANHNSGLFRALPSLVPSYHKISKNASKSQRARKEKAHQKSSKLPQNFKECKQITTIALAAVTCAAFQATTKFQRMQANHNLPLPFLPLPFVPSYHKISKNASKSQHFLNLIRAAYRSKLPQNFKECKQITTCLGAAFQKNVFQATTKFQRMQANHNTLPLIKSIRPVPSYHKISKNASKSQLATTPYR